MTPTAIEACAREMRGYMYSDWPHALTWEQLRPMIRADWLKIAEWHLERVDKVAAGLTCPWPEDIFPATIEQYIKVIPDGDTRTAISGLLMRMGFEEAIRQIKAQSDTQSE